MVGEGICRIADIIQGVHDKRSPVTPVRDRRPVIAVPEPPPVLSIAPAARRAEVGVFTDA